MKGWTTQTAGSGGGESPHYIALFNDRGELKDLTSMGGPEPVCVAAVSTRFAWVAVAEDLRGES